jgi:hypothetical protein
MKNIIYIIMICLAVVGSYILLLDLQMYLTIKLGSFGELLSIAIGLLFFGVLINKLTKRVKAT